MAMEKSWNEMGSMGPKNEGKDKIEDSQERHDTLVLLKIRSRRCGTFHDSMKMALWVLCADVSYAEDDKADSEVSVYDNDDLICYFFLAILLKVTKIRLLACSLIMN